MKLGAAHKTGCDRMPGNLERLEVPGYHDLQRLDGAEEAWSAEGPGGFRAALRVVRPATGVDLDELQALLARRRLRHPNLQAVFGSWRVGTVLVLATELPDGTLWDRFRDAAAAGLPGVPRDDLIAALVETARAADYLNDGPRRGDPAGSVPPLGPGLGHGDIAPRTILFVGGGVKLADLDPFRWLGPQAGQGTVPLYPLYAAPERLAGRTSRQADQYSLAATYGHLRTGRLLSASDLRMLPGAERSAVERALAHDSADRWPSCRAFVEALRAAAEVPEPAPAPAPPAAGTGLAPPADPREEPDDHPGWAESDDPARPAGSRSASFALAAATGAATLAGTLWLHGAAVPGSGPLKRPEADLRADAPEEHAAPLMTRAALGPARVRLQDSVAGPAGPAAGHSPAPPVVAPEPEIDPFATPDFEPDPPSGEVSVVTPSPLPARAPVESNRPSGPPLVAAVAVPPEPPKPPPSASVDAARPEIRLSAPRSLTVLSGDSAELEVTVASRGVHGRLEVRLESLPRGLESEPATLWLRGAPVGADTPAPGAGESSEPERIKLLVRAGTEATEGDRRARLVATSGAARVEARIRVKVRPTASLVARRRGDAELNRGDHAAALASFSEAIRLDPGDHLAYHGRGLAAYHAGDLGRALADLDAALMIKPESATALNNRGLARLARGETAAAVADFDEAIRLDPAYAVVRFNRGRAFAESGAADRALADYAEAIRLDPKFAKAYRARASLYSKRGDRDRAQADYETVLRLSPSDTTARNNLGLLLVARGEPHRAIAEFDEAIRIDPKYAVARYNRGRVYQALGDLVEALASFDQAVRLDPSLTRAAEARSQILARRADLAASRTGPGLGTATRTGANGTDAAGAPRSR